MFLLLGGGVLRATAAEIEKALLRRSCFTGRPPRIPAAGLARGLRYQLTGKKWSPIGPLDPERDLIGGSSRLIFGQPSWEVFRP